MERPIVDSLFINQDEWGLKALFEPTIQKLVRLDHAGWRTQFATDGFSDVQIKTLDSLVQVWLNQMDKDGLSERLTAIEAIQDDTEIDQVIIPWLDQLSRVTIAEEIRRSRFPTPLVAVCYAVSQLAHIIDAAVGFETMRRELLEKPSSDWCMTPEQIAEGVALAEEGLAEDAKIWPAY
jgi:hypothetical protein